MNVKDPFFEEYRQYKETKYGQDGAKGVPKSMVLWGTFHGNKDAFQAAVAVSSICLSAEYDLYRGHVQR